MGYGGQPAGSRGPRRARTADHVLALSRGVGYEDAVAVVCVLGCRAGSAALARRARAARDAFIEHRASLVVTCGGVAWDGRVEADELARMLGDGGVPEEAIVRERASRDTYENAACAAALLRSRGVREAVIVTCCWHVPRARKLFERAGLRVVASVGVPAPDAGFATRIYWAARERVALVKDLMRRTVDA